MELFLIDAIGPFFRGYRRKRINWSKIPFMHLEGASEDDWHRIHEDLRTFARAISNQGYNAVSLDDLAHLAHHPLHEPQVRDRIALLRAKFAGFFSTLQDEFGLRVYLTSDVLPATAAMHEAFGSDRKAWHTCYHSLVCQILDDFPQLSGLILRVGESDGKDVKDPIRTHLHLRSPRETNRLLHDLLPEFEQRGMDLIFRTWTVGVHRIGDLIWHRKTLSDTLAGLDSPRLIVSMKHGESDFFRHLPLNRSIFRTRQRVLLELQARREYEGAGEYPSFIGNSCERFARELKDHPNITGISVWCQTGGWHRFRRRAFLETDGSDIWIRLNTAAAISVFKHGEAADMAVMRLAGPRAIELARLSEAVVSDLLYIEEFAKQKWFFRRVRIPPMIHVYWDSLFINDGVRQIMRHFVRDHDRALRTGEDAFKQFPRMLEIAGTSNLPVADIEHMRDFFHLVLLARRYYFQHSNLEAARDITAARKAYKKRWPRHHRYRIKLSLKPVPVKRSTLALATLVLLRRRRGYRLIDRLVLLYLAGTIYKLLAPHLSRRTPKFLRKSAMGIEVLFK